MKSLTIFTPTYNRAYILIKLYNSLKSQTSKDFIWLIVDDGSTDNTTELVKKWIYENLIKIEYYKQENSGKSMAHNKGVELTKTELFTCVDSDDFLTTTAVDDILKCWSSKNKMGLVGILAYKGLPNGNPLTLMKKTNIELTTLKAAYAKHGLRGDTMLIFKTDIVSKYKFPQFKSEKFVPEAYLYDLIDRDGELFLLRKVLYCCEYLDDGYTKNMAKLLIENPSGYLTYIKQRLMFDKNLKNKILNTIRYTAICIAVGKEKYIRKSIFPIITIFTLPIGYILYIKRYKKL